MSAKMIDIFMTVKILINKVEHMGYIIIFIIHLITQIITDYDYISNM